MVSPLNLAPASSSVTFTQLPSIVSGHVTLEQGRVSTPSSHSSSGSQSPQSQADTVRTAALGNPLTFAPNQEGISFAPPRDTPPLYPEALIPRRIPSQRELEERHEGLGAAVAESDGPFESVMAAPRRATPPLYPEALIPRRIPSQRELEERHEGLGAAVAESDGPLESVMAAPRRATPPLYPEALIPRRIPSQRELEERHEGLGAAVAESDGPLELVMEAPPPPPLTKHSDSLLNSTPFKQGTDFTLPPIKKANGNQVTSIPLQKPIATKDSLPKKPEPPHFFAALCNRISFFVTEGVTRLVNWISSWFYPSSVEKN